MSCIFHGFNEYVGKGGGLTLMDSGKEGCVGEVLRGLGGLYGIGVVFQGTGKTHQCLADCIYNCHFHLYIHAI